MIWSNLASTLLKANEKELFKTYPKLNKKYPDSQLEHHRRQCKKLPRLSTAIIYRRQCKNYPDSQLLLFTGCSVLIKKLVSNCFFGTFVTQKI